MATYCTDDDLVEIRPDILTHGVSSWETQRVKAFGEINRIMTARWFRQTAIEMGYDPTLYSFDPTLVLENSLKDLECYKTLEFAYTKLMKGTAEEDGFERMADKFRQLYNEELEMVLGTGLSYDWTGNGIIDAAEKLLQAPRRLKRA